MSRLPRNSDGSEEDPIIYEAAGPTWQAYKYWVPMPIEKASQKNEPDSWISATIDFDDEDLFNFDDSKISQCLGTRFSTKRSLEPFIPFVDHRKVNGIFSPIAENNKWINVDHTIRGWLSLCTSQHEQHCLDPKFLSLSNEGSRPMWLLDGKNWCLVPATNGKRYFALSYVWGTVESSFTTLENLNSLQEKGSLLKQGIVIPKLILDVLRLVVQLGESFLWVDRFCIVQNDVTHKEHQLKAMADIYARSYATIIAADKSFTHSGLYGLQGITKPRKMEESSQCLDNLLDHFDKPEKLRQHLLANEANSLLKSDWGTRGWTFQEYLFSTRRIVFQNESVIWDCHCACWLECQSLPQDSVLCGRSSAIIRSGESWPDAYQFARLMSLYNQRLLTYPRDVHDAFSGALSVIGNVFQGGFVSGIPQMFLDAFLLWQPFTPLERREDKHSNSRRISVHLPSWSWIGWQGDIDSKSLRSAYGYIKKQPDEFFQENQDDWEPSSWTTISTVKWSYILDAGAKPMAIPTFDHVHGESGTKHSSGEVLSKGWTAHEEHGHRKYYKHSSDLHQEFWYPVPIREQTNEPSPVIFAPFLTAKVRHARLQIGHWFKNETTSRCMCVTLLDRGGKEVGFLRWNHGEGPPVIQSPTKFDVFGEDEEQNKTSLAEPTGNEWPSGLVDLIELSSGFATYQKTEWVSFDEWSDKPQSGERYEFYNVMLIRKEGGLSLRVAVGRVSKTAWESENLFTEDVILG